MNLINTSRSDPEQYDAIVGDEQVGHLHLRRGRFVVECPVSCGEIVYEAFPGGYGRFLDDERDKYLDLAKQKIAEWLRSHKTLEE